LTELGLGARLNFLPEKLSGGEKQRVAIARALVNDPALILADEPTANLDSKIGHEIMRLLRAIAKEQGRSVVIVSHDQRIRDIADRVLWLEDGAFKDAVTMATDPVCGMGVERERAVSAERDGDVFFFCSRGCREEFLGAFSSAAPGQGLTGLIARTRKALRHPMAHRRPLTSLRGAPPMAESLVSSCPSPPLQTEAPGSDIPMPGGNRT
jgi:energy-coupling factor transporter ATP-binding protein EcfA2